jgi:hypothetical protein
MVQVTYKNHHSVMAEIVQSDNNNNNNNNKKKYVQPEPSQNNSENT